MSWRPLGLIAVLLAAGCEPAYSVGEPLSPTTETLASRAVSIAVPLSEGTLLVDDGTDLTIVTEGAAEAVTIGRSGEIGDLLAFASIDGRSLVAGSEGTFVVQTSPSAALFRAPIETALAEGESIFALAVTARIDAPSDLWVATDRGLYLFRDEELTEIAVADTDLGQARLAAPAGTDGSLWVATSESVLRLTLASRSVALTATRLERPSGARSIAVDADGAVWLVTEDGVGFVQRDLHFYPFILPFTATRVLSAPDSRDVWLELEDGGFYHQLRRVFRPVMSPRLERALMGPNGTLFAANDSGVLRVSARHPIAIEGLHSGPVLERTRIEVRLPSPTSVTAVRVRADEISLDVEGPIGDASRAPSFFLEPGPIPVGSHTLMVEADYDDGTLTAELSVPIDIATDATWSADILPLYETYCADCHGPRGPSPTRLDARADWMTRSERIIDNVMSGRMPLGRSRIPESDVALIQAWASGGFAE